MGNTFRSLVPAFAIAFAGLFLTHCAPFLKRDPSVVARVFVGPSERLLLRVQPFDSTVKLELSRTGLDPAGFEEEFNHELRYRFLTRNQEGAPDSVSAEVVLTISLQHLQPGAGNFGTFAAYSAKTERGASMQRGEWTLRKPAKANVPPAFLARDLSRTLADEIMKQIPAARPRAKEPPPPLQLL